MGKSYTVILGECTTFTRSKLESLKSWEEKSEKSDLISLMKGITGLIFNQDDVEYL